ncbi:RagB/SusD family nutrient uptake outer membrane protein [Chitinophaga arvensicola]|uniref:SusD family protein n=1 Tax=Chitinophaga arvensicola TaxID=29529 RepID=A0A1I0S8G5_9BACT|nr:RagB/SusD family nutrient uptake outer membrane protein [Chitinophaga arvensicola]SEW52282.1 SusD family protein [Chitinophaga arvensicola]
MIRKYFLLINLCLFVASTFVACSKKLDEPVPDTAIGEQTLKPADLALLVKGAYSKIHAGWPSQTYPLFDIYADDIISMQGGSITRFNPQAYDACNPNPSDGFSNGFYYNGAYTAIGNANTVINYIRSRELTGQNKDLGEALGIRGYCYLRLVEAYKGVIITLGSNEDPAELKRPQNTEEEVFNRIITDLKEAEKLLPPFSTPDALSKEAVQLLLARIYLNRGDKVEAKKYAEAVIGSTSAALTSDFSSNFRYNNPENKELLFRVVEGPVSSSYDRAGMFPLFSPGLPYRRPTGATGNGQTWVNADLVNAYEAGDVRAGLFKNQMAASVGRVVTYLMKFSLDTLQDANSFVTYPLIRLSEAYLISAEADARQDVVNVTRYNAVRQKRNASPKTTGDFPSAANFLQEIEMERRKEFLGEGLRWQDMKRFGKAIPFLSSKGQNETRLYLPFVNAELNRNPKLVQNNGYK